MSSQLPGLGKVFRPILCTEIGIVHRANLVLKLSENPSRGILKTKLNITGTLFRTYSEILATNSSLALSGNPCRKFFLKSIRKLMVELFFLNPFRNSCWQLFLKVADTPRLSLSHGMHENTVCSVWRYIYTVQINPIESLLWNFFDTYSFPWLTPPPPISSMHQQYTIKCLLRSCF